MGTISKVTKRLAVPLVIVMALAMGGCGLDLASEQPQVVVEDPAGAEPSEPTTVETSEPEQKAESEQKEADPKPVADVFTFPKTCKADEYGWIFHKGKITNKSGETRSYYFTFEVLDAKGERVDEALGGADKVAPGQTVNVEATGMEEFKPGQEFTCKLLDSGFFTE